MERRARPRQRRIERYKLVKVNDGKPVGRCPVANVAVADSDVSAGCQPPSRQRWDGLIVHAPDIAGDGVESRQMRKGVRAVEAAVPVGDALAERDIARRKVNDVEPQQSVMFAPCTSKS